VEIERTPARLWPAAAAVLLVALVWQVLTFNGFPNDHYFHVARARQMLLGAWPIRDFVDPGASLQYVVSAISRWWFGDRIAAELFVVALGVAVGAAATVVAASWLARSTIVGVVVALLEILASPRSYSYPKMLLYGLAGCAIVAVTAHATRARLLLAAGLTAVAFLMRHDHGLFIGAASAAAILLSAPGVTESVKRLSLYAVGVAALLAPWAVWVQYYQGLVPYFRMGIGVSRREADISLMRHLPRLQPFDGLTTENAHAWLFYLFWSLPLICVALAGYRRLTQRERWAGELAAVAGIALLALALDATFLRNPLETRLADATVPAALLGAWLAGLVSTIPLRTAIGVSARTAAAVVLIGTTVAIWRLGDVNGKLDEAGVFDDWDHVREHTRLLLAVIKRPDMEVRKFPSRVSAGLVPFFHYLARCTLPTDRLLVSGSYPDVFVLARRGFAGGQVAFVEALYASDADQALTLSRMRHESVPFVLLVRDEQAAFAGSFPRILAYIDEAYQPMTDVSIAGMQGVRVLVERQRRPTGVDFNTGWPCYR
jgi:hypothetical protein